MPFLACSGNAAVGMEATRGRRQVLVADGVLALAPHLVQQLPHTSLILSASSNRQNLAPSAANRYRRAARTAPPGPSSTAPPNSGPPPPLLLLAAREPRGPPARTA